MFSRCGQYRLHDHGAGTAQHYLRRKKPFNAPDAVFVRWAADLWTLREQDKAGDIRYLCGKTDLREYLSQGLQLLRIDLMKGGKNAREAR